MRVTLDSIDKKLNRIIRILEQQESTAQEWISITEFRRRTKLSYVQIRRIATAQEDDKEARRALGRAAAKADNMKKYSGKKLI